MCFRRYVRIANLNEAGIPLPGYSLRATCFKGVGAAHRQGGGGRLANETGDAAAAVAALPCPVPDPAGQECLGRGQCKVDSKISPHSLASRYCECGVGFAGTGCQRPLKPLALNAPTKIDLPAGGWAYYYVDLPFGQRESPQFLNGELLVTMRRTADLAAGVGGDPLLFVKPYGALVGVMGVTRACAALVCQCWCQRLLSIATPNRQPTSS